MERATDMSKSHGPLRIGIGGPVGSGKTALMDLLCKTMRERYDIAAITNDIYTKWDAEFLVRSGSLTPDRIAGVETGGCPHTAIREDASMNLAAVADMRAKFRRGGRQDSVEGGPGHYPVGPSRHQQDRSCTACRRLAGENGHRREKDARRAALRHDQP